MPSPTTRLSHSLALATFGLLTFIAPSFAAPPTMVMPGDDAAANSDAPPDTSFFGSLSRQSGLLGTMGGIRPWLSQYGISFGLLETSELLGNLTGGVHKSFDYDGLTQAAVQMDTQRAFGLYGGTFNVSALQLHGRNLSADNLQSLQTASGIESDRSTRLWELWYDQKFLNEDRMDIKIGEQSLDQEFMVSQNALSFVNTMFGWPMVPSADMPGGGPAYPLAAPGIRVRVRPIDQLNILAGVFSGSPASRDDGDPQKINGSGTQFPFTHGTLFISELQYLYPSLGGMVDPEQGRELAGTYKLGMWYDTGRFDDQHYGTDGLSLADPGSNGNPAQHHGNYAIYGVADQMLWADDDNDGDRTLNGFVRVMGSPLANRNLIDFSANVGFVLHEPFDRRDNDSVGIGMGYAHVSNRAAAQDKDTNAFGTPTPVRSSETFVEADYIYQATSWWQLQPDVQYVFNPGGGTTNSTTGERVKNELVVGLRTNIAF